MYANDVEVGQMTVADLQAIRKQTLRDWRTYTSQAANCVTLTLNVANRIFRDVPVVWFWVIAALALFRPSGFLEMVTIGLSSPTRLAQAFTVSLQLALFLTAIALPFESAISHQRFGFVNVYSAGVNRRIRQALKLPVDSALVLVHPRLATLKRPK
ncbi:hypothetical protein [Burkholderia cenocepacia]|uniref:hypothetical protein n=1 Tax=Burkholderia cenocepacia TaxID=95486 RepID=UPI001237177B|nr:hypothetical protein [Burkholderia cenocepacia]